jgi:hypothetical protein
MASMRISVEAFDSRPDRFIIPERGGNTQADVDVGFRRMVLRFEQIAKHTPPARGNLEHLATPNAQYDELRPLELSGRGGLLQGAASGGSGVINDPTSHPAVRWSWRQVVVDFD